MTEQYAEAKARMMLGGGRVRLDGASVTGWLMGGSILLTQEARAQMLMGGSVAVVETPRPGELAPAQYILIAGPDLYDDDRTRALICMGTGGRSVRWGLLQEGSELDTEDIQVIQGEKGRAIGVVFTIQRTEVTLTAIFLDDVPRPKRGELITWLNVDSLPITARILQRQVSYTLDGAAVMQIRATKWDGLS